MLYPTLGIIGLFIIAGLSAYAWSLTRRVRQQDAEREKQREELETQIREQRERVNRSIQVIAQGMLEDQLTLTEGAIRIRVLLESLQVESDIQEEFQAFYLLADATSHIPILDAWKALKIKEKLVYDQEREKLESDHREFVVDAAQRIQNRHF